MRTSRKWTTACASAALALALTPDAAWAVAERSAPRASLDPAANVSDLYVFRSWAEPGKLVLVMNVNPGQEPGDGPSYFNFDDEVLYRFHVDNDLDGRADDVVYEVRFDSEHRPALGLYTFVSPYTANPRFLDPELRAITALNGPGSDGLTWRQTYTVIEQRGGVRRQLFRQQRLSAVPANLGPVTMPDYEALAAQGIYTDESARARVFAGQRASVTYGDLGALFDGAELRRFPPILTPEEDVDDTINPYGVNRYAGTNVSSIVLEIPIERLTRDRRPAETTSAPLLGVYASASRHRRALMAERASFIDSHEGWVQISRLGNAMVNPLFVEVPQKDRYNAGDPRNDANFVRFFRDPTLAQAPSNQLFGIPVPPPPRGDLMSMYLKYPGQPVFGNNCGWPCAELLRVNVAVPPTPPESQQRMGMLYGADPAGIPNGRRPNDDVVDFSVRVIGGPGLIFARVSDGVNFADGLPGAGTSDGPGYGTIPGNKLDVTSNGITKEFPYLATPHDGRSSGK